MREIRPSGSEGGVAHLRHPYPYFEQLSLRDRRDLAISMMRRRVG